MGWIPPRLRPLLGSDLGAVDAAALDQLIGVPEDSDLDFKSTLPSTSDGDTKETAYDVAQFANAAGGLLILGIEEDGDGRASSVVGVEAPARDFGLWLHQVVATRLTPNASVVHRSVIVADDRAVHLVSVAPSILAPHGVQVGDFAMRHPLRVGNTRRWLSEGEIADRYRSRFTAIAARSELTERMHADAIVRFAGRRAENQEGADKAWLLLGLVPDSAGRLELQRGTARQWNEWVSIALTRFPSQLDRRISEVNVGFRSLELTDAHGSDRAHYFLAGTLNLDGSGLLAVAHPGGRGSHGIPTDTCAVFDEHLIADLLNGLAMLAEHAVRAGCVGDATISAQLRSASPAREMVLGQYRSMHSSSVLRGSRRAGVDTGMSRHAVPIETIIGQGPDRLIGARLLACDLWSAFGLAEPQQVTASLELVADRFARDVHQPMRSWATAFDVPVIEHLPE